MEPDSRWEDFAACIDMPIRFFHKDEGDTEEAAENYEEDEQIALITDEICLSCPVIQQCLDKGRKGGEWGVWGGVYLSAGKLDKTRNSHKTQEVWDRWAARVNPTKR